jgi:triacylglycerol esterase/lipase EstA (alpha/beta hydrolase family)
MHPHPSPAGARGHLPSPGRRLLLLGAGSVAMALALSACGSLAPPIETRPPIVFVHGNGDSAALWLTTLWRFESQGWPRDRLDAIDLPYPLARDDDTVAQAGRSSAAEQAQVLASTVDRVLARTGARSRWCWWAIRAVATRSATTCRTSAAQPRCRMPCWAAPRATGCRPTRR